jgi:Zn-dependent protease
MMWRDASIVRTLLDAVMRKVLRLGRLFGIDLMLDPSWVVVFALIVWTLTSVFAAWHPGWTSGTVLVVAVVTALCFFVSVLAHELAHALVAKAYGLGVRDITLHIFGGASKLEREPSRPGIELVIAAAGPITSALIGVAMLVLAPLTAGSASTQTLLVWLGPVNIALAAFNLIPGFPMDGGRILRAAVWKATGNLVTATRWTSLVGQAIGLAFIAVAGLMAIGLRVPYFGTGVVSALWLAFIGMFVRGAAKQHQASAEARLALEGVTVAALMRPGVRGVPANASIRSLVDDEFVRREEAVLPVFFGERFIGIVGLADIASIPPAEWDERTAREIMRPAASLPPLSPSDAVLEAFRTMGATGFTGAAVVEDGELVAMLFARDIARWVGLHREARKRRLLPT